MKYNHLEIPEILQGFCDKCGKPVSIPHQSSYRIKEFREQVSHQLEIRVPAHYTDILIAIGAVHNLSRKPNLLCRLITELYLEKARSRPKDIGNRIVKALDDELAQGKSNNRLSCLFSNTSFTALETFAGQEKMKSSTLVKSLIVAAKHDILDHEDKEMADGFGAFVAGKL
jgi:hypothetical protein